MSKSERISSTSVLVSEELKKQISSIFSKMSKKVELKAVLDFEDEKSLEMGAFLRAIASCSDLITVKFYEKNECEGIDKELHAEYLPVVGLYDDSYTGVCFHGTPGGKEINSFIAAIYTLGGASSALDKRVAKHIDSISKELHLKIFVSLACHHCPHVVAACQKIALANDLVTAEMYDAKLYPDLVEKYKIERIPMTVINDSVIFMGQKTLEEIVNRLMNI